MPCPRSESCAKRRRSLFRPCIDLHQGVVKQIVGGTLRDDENAAIESIPASAAGTLNALRTNHTSTLPPSHFASLYRQHSLYGAHVIKLGPGNDASAKQALATWPGHLQVGGGINAANASEWLAKGAAKVIVTSFLFPACNFSLDRLKEMEAAVGGRENLVVDVSCRRQAGKWVVAMNKWQDLTDMQVDMASLDMLAEHCSEFLIHAADVEGLCGGIDEDLVRFLGQWLPTLHERTGRLDFVVTYAGGARHLGDMQLVDQLSNGTVDLTFGSALDIFGGSGVTMEELVRWNQGTEQEQVQAS
ncbi:Phosphoribosylformimino-5-aminoimidazole carboxamide ribotide isomerase [Tilletiaria anomala UBC 951]|uniref:1-(5-phosphoribosyl)-5-[(5-phosphoribosylamino)methylideneamino] imidazole-4-carboxamide isomerase n=1 Tax=Tilletiaria anomala (strain ATCC 24038 / CBS 436.72 / UBC 951) TaxID=1037660 RepID=A0A066W2C4_TILAU|nr:Phosphoribosylformimino-5-aminoimidazole carboxamide ribotide isomerase [Tilletiaria anomala UBC 951]KDN44920.1 Phosphoribosylformimino-5-aminoimidazole carboxamide ribotide isomerase [Tilletiaria anomala UBC 951]